MNAGWAPLAAVALAAGAANASSPERQWRSELEARISPLVASFDGELSLFVMRLDDGSSFAIDAQTPTYLASAVKVAVMLEVLRQVDAGTLSLDREIVFGEDDVRDGMWVLHSARPGQVFTVGTLLEYMVRFSDNAAADLLIREVGVHSLNAGLAERGVHFGPLRPLIEVRRLAYAALDPEGAALTSGEIRALGDARGATARARAFSQMVIADEPFGLADLDRAFDALYARGLNSAPMREMGTLLGQIARCEGLSESSCALAHQLLHGVTTGTQRVRAGLPPTVAWAHKTGTQHRRACDVGFATFPAGNQVVIAACTRDFARVSEAERLLADIGREVAAVMDLAPMGGSITPVTAR